MLLINDGSTDNIDKIKEYIKKNKNIKLIELTKNKGASEARNHGIKEATGEYIAFLDSDDEFVKDKLKIQLTQMVLKKYKVSHASYIREGLDEESIVMHSGIQTGKMIPELIKSCQIATPTVMIETNFLKNNHYLFNPNLVYGEDTCFWLTILKKEKLLGIDIPLAIVHANSSSSAYDVSKQIIGIKTILAFVLNDSDLNIYDLEISRLSQYYINLVNSSQNTFKEAQDMEKATIVDEDRYNAIINSHSWKITAPLRKAKTGINMIKNEGFGYFLKRLYKKIKYSIKKIF